MAPATTAAAEPDAVSVGSVPVNDTFPTSLCGSTVSAAPSLLVGHGGTTATPAVYTS